MKVLHHVAIFLLDGVLAQLDVLRQQFGRPLAVVARILLDLLEQPPVGAVGGVVRQHVQDEALLDGLAHGVEVERLVGAVGLAGAEELQRLVLGRGGEGEEADVRLAAPRADLRHDAVFPVLALLVL